MVSFPDVPFLQLKAREQAWKEMPTFDEPQNRLWLCLQLVFWKSETWKHPLQWTKETAKISQEERPSISSAYAYKLLAMFCSESNKKWLANVIIEKLKNSISTEPSVYYLQRLQEVRK